MSGAHRVSIASIVEAEEEIDESPLKPLGERSPAKAQEPDASMGLAIGELIGLTDGGLVALVRHAEQPGMAALPARTVVDLHGAHIGRPVALMFEAGDRSKPVVMGVLRASGDWPLADRPGQVQVDADGERLIVSAKEQLVFRCGKASITLTQAGKVLIEGTYVSSRSAGANRLKGGSIHLN